MDATAHLREFKVVTIGESGVGKTSIARRFVDGYFEENVPLTVGAAFLKATVSVNNVPVLLNIWDTAGQERFQSLIPLYLRNANACLLVVDISDNEYVNKLEKLYKNIKEIMPFCTNLIVVGNKRDKVPTDCDFSDLANWTAKNKLDYTITSAKTGENIDLLFKEVATMVLASSTDIQEDSTAQSLESSENHSSSCC